MSARPIRPTRASRSPDTCVVVLERALHAVAEDERLTRQAEICNVLLEWLRNEQSSASVKSDALVVPLRPWPFQREMLQRLETERERHYRRRNLVAAATGTGKTLVAAFDYRRLRERLTNASLLFVAHRREILFQSLNAYRAVLRDGSFGELLVDGQRPEQGRHVFASVQSLAQIDLADIAPDALDVVVIDEFHHAAAPTYERLVKHLKPRILLGLTPRRSAPMAAACWSGSTVESPSNFAFGMRWTAGC